MQNEILINATPGETRVAVLEKKQFFEFHLERARSKSVTGSVVKGRVLRVLPGMQAAFVDIGLEKAAFLYAGDYVEDIEEIDEDGGGRHKGRRNRHAPSIETLVREGQEIVVQIAKEPIGSKGARITSHISIAGRHLVLTPWAQRVGVSRKIDSDRERRRLREIVQRVKPADLGFIIRTAGEGTRDADLEADVRYLTTVWDDIQIRKDQVRAPAVLYSEPDLALRVIRDFANADTKRIVIDSASVHAEMAAFVERFVADPKPRIEHYQGALPIFDEFGIEEQIDTNLGRKVWLKNGGYLIVEFMATRQHNAVHRFQRMWNLRHRGPFFPADDFQLRRLGQQLGPQAHFNPQFHRLRRERHGVGRTDTSRQAFLRQHLPLRVQNADDDV